MMPDSLSSFNLMNILPNLISQPEIELNKGDIFIHSPGFEDRTLAFKNIIKFGTGVNAILFDYRPFNPKNKLEEVRYILESFNVAINEKDIIEYNRFNPDNFEFRLKDRLISLGARRVVIDISTMSKLQIMLVLNTCKDIDLIVQILYSEAQNYRPTKEEFEESKKLDKVHQPSLQIISGVYGVVRVKSLASVSMQGQPTAAILFMSFNDILTQVLLNSVYPGRLLLINGRPPVHSWREEATAWIHDRVRREWHIDNPVSWNEKHSIQMPQRVVSTLYYAETVQLLLKLYWELSFDHRILLAPSGSKMQTVGCFIAKALHPDIHIEYSAPEGFSRGYSSDIGPCWAIDFGRISNLLSQISIEERKEFLEI